MRNVQSSEFSFMNKSRDYRLRYSLKSSLRVFEIMNVAKQRPQGDKSCCSSFLRGLEKRKNSQRTFIMSVFVVSIEPHLTRTRGSSDVAEN